MATQPMGKPGSPLKLDYSTANRCTTIVCHGRVVAETADYLKDTVRRLVDRSASIQLDLADVDYMDSAGLGALMAAYTSARKEDCDFQLLNLSPRVANLLHTTKLNTILKIKGNLL